jgi:acyl carrier protein
MDKYDAEVHQVLKDLMEEEKSETRELKNDDRLVEDLGFSSLNMARIIAILEDQFGTDPFSKSVAITSIRTVGDLAGAYRQTLEADPAREPVKVTPLIQSQQRAAARRAALAESTRRDVG